MGYFKQQNKDLTTWCINGINQPQDSYDMIYGGFQSMGVPLIFPKSSILDWDFPWKQPTAKHFWGTTMTMEPPLAMKNCLG